MSPGLLDLVGRLDSRDPKERLVLPEQVERLEQQVLVEYRVLEDLPEQLVSREVLEIPVRLDSTDALAYQEVQAPQVLWVVLEQLDPVAQPVPPAAQVHPV